MFYNFTESQWDNTTSKYFSAPLFTPPPKKNKVSYKGNTQSNLHVFKVNHLCHWLTLPAELLMYNDLERQIVKVSFRDHQLRPYWTGSQNDFVTIEIIRCNCYETFYWTIHQSVFWKRLQGLMHTARNKKRLYDLNE